MDSGEDKKGVSGGPTARVEGNKAGMYRRMCRGVDDPS